MRYGLTSSLLLAIVAVIFALQNPQSMEVNLLVFQTEGSTALVLILTFGLGVLVGLLSTIPGRLQTRRKLKALQAQVKADDSNNASSNDSTSPPSNT